MLAAVIALVAATTAGSALLDLDFSTATGKTQVARGTGCFEGVLPEGLIDNFSNWSDGHVTATPMTEGGRSFLRLATKSGRESGGQFMASPFAGLTSGCYRAEVVARNPRRDRRVPLHVIARLGAPTYRTLWSADFVSRDWTVQTKLFRLEKTAERPGLFLLTTPGMTVDLARLTITPVPLAEFRASLGQNRPPAAQRRLSRHTRFPLGLPSGWNTSRECVFGEVSSGTSDDGLATLRFSAERDSCLYSEPFLSAGPGETATVRLRYRASGSWKADVIADTPWHVLARTDLPESKSWREATLTLREPDGTAAMAVRLAGRGMFELDCFDICRGTETVPADPDRAAEVTLQVTEGEIASTHIQFADEPARLSWAVTGAPKGAALRLSVTDLYGTRRELGTVALAGRPLETGRLDYEPPSGRALGQFRVDAEVVADGRRISPPEELVVTRLPRPVYWRRPAPDSPFGTHLIARRDTLLAAKAAGINWTRFHDAGAEYSCWSHLEPEKGKWTFRDREINRFRDACIGLYAQLGTAPAWATHCAETRYAGRPNDYFARYLRPTNTVDFLNYVTTFVTRYRGVIDDYFIWNEPWGRWWVTGEDAKFFSSDRAELVRQYGELSKASFAAVKAANPQARVSGFNATTGNVDWFVRPLADVGVMEACDNIDFHFYTPSPRLCQADDVPVSAGPLKLLRERWPDLMGKRVIMSEGQGVSSGDSGVKGRMTGLYRRILPFAPETLESCRTMADQTCRYALDLLSEGVSRVFVYTTHSYETLAVKPMFLSYFGADGYPHPELVAQAHMARLVEDRTFVAKTPYGRFGVKLTFRGKDGSTVEAYTELLAEEAAALAAAHPGACTDIYGNVLTPETFAEGTLVYVSLAESAVRK